MNLDELAQAALAGHENALNELARYLDHGLRRYFRARWAPDVADDLVQRTFVAMLEHTDRFEPRGKNAFVRWVYGIAKLENLMMHGENAKAARKRGKLARVNKTPARGLSSFIMLMESIDILDDEIEQLPPAQRQAVDKFLGKQRGEERSPDRYRGVTLHRARKKLRRKLTESLGTPAPPKPNVDTPAT